MSKSTHLLHAGLSTGLIAGVFLTLLFIDPLAVQGFREPKIAVLLFLAGISGLLGSLQGVRGCMMGNEPIGIPVQLTALLPLVGLLMFRFCKNASGGFDQAGEYENLYTLYVLTPAAAWLVLVASAWNVFRAVRLRRLLSATILLALAAEVSIVFLEILQNQTGLRLNPLSFAGEIDLLGQELREKIYGTIGNPNFVAGYLAIAFFPVLGWVLSTSRRVTGSLGVGVLSAAALAILAARSKGAVLALSVGGAHFLFLVWRDRWHEAKMSSPMSGNCRWVSGALILLIVFVLLVGWMLADQSAGPEEGSFLHHWLETLSLKGDSIAVRALLAECGFSMWEPHPWTGIGAGQFKIQFLETLRKMLQGEDADLFMGRVARLQSLRANHLHNEYLQILVEWGIMGLASVLLFLAWSQVSALNAIDHTPSRRDRWVRMGLLSGFWAALGGSLFDLPFHRPSQVFLLALLLGASLAPVQLSVSTGRAKNRAISWITVLIFLPLSIWFCREATVRYVSLREVFMAKSVLEGKIPGGDIEKAATTIQRAVRWVPGAGDYYYYLAHIQLHSRKDPNAAITTLRRAHMLSDEPGLYLLEARAHIEKGNSLAAEPLLNFIKTLDNDRPGLHYLLGRIYQGSQRLEDARAEYLADIHWSETAPSEPNPDLEDSILRLAALLEDAGDFNQAVVFYKKFLALKDGQIPTYPLAQLNLARIYTEHLFDRELSRKYLEEARDIFIKNRNSKEAQRIDEELKNLSRGAVGQP